MSLKHKEGWNMPADYGFYPPLPAMYRNVKMQFVFFHTLPNNVIAFLPEPLKPSETGLCVAGGIDVPFCTHYGAFQESFILMQCRFEATTGFYCSHVFHNGPAGIAAGREIYGTPKVFADVRVRYPGRTMLTETIFNGASLFNIHSSLEEILTKDSMPSLSPAWRLKILPRADGPGPAIKQLIDCSQVTRDLILHFQAKGQGRITLGESLGCDLTPLAPQSYGDAFYQECDYSEGYAKIVYDYLQRQGDRSS
jgi:acetoacetate decarboxylase